MDRDVIGNALAGLARMGLALACVQAASGAQAGELAVTARVLPSRPAPHALHVLALPPGSRLLTTHPFARSFNLDGPPVRALEFFGDGLPRQGYRLVHASRDGTELVWVSDGVRLLVQLQAVIGAVPRTRIVVQASARGGER